jgi:hypothetical protein
VIAPIVWVKLRKDSSSLSLVSHKRAAFNFISDRRQTNGSFLLVTKL